MEPSGSLQGPPRDQQKPPRNLLGTPPGTPETSQGPPSDPQAPLRNPSGPPEPSRPSTILPRPSPEITRAVVAAFVEHLFKNSPAASSHQPLSSRQQPATSDQQPTSSDPHPAVDSKTWGGDTAAFVARQRGVDLHWVPSALSLAQRNARSD